MMRPMIPVLVSACLVGEKVRYNGADKASATPVLSRWLAEGRVVRFCPEVGGGLGVPRPPAGIRGGGGLSVLDGDGRVVTSTGVDVTREFRLGAERALEVARRERVGLAVLKENSPSCGSLFIHDGSFSGGVEPGQGVTTALLERNGIRVFGEDRLADAADYLAALEAASSTPDRDRG